jgi:hypothetical protein
MLKSLSQGKTKIIISHLLLFARAALTGFGWAVVAMAGGKDPSNSRNKRPAGP